MTAEGEPQVRRFTPLLIALLAFAAIAPTLTWLEFSNGSENLVVGTALEVRRSGQWLIPTLHEKTRLAKPPLTTWITAAAITDDTMRAVSSTDAAERSRGFVKLAWQVRWPGLVAACVMLLMTARLGSLIAGPRGGVMATLVLASCILFLRFARYETTDIHLAMWVAITNVLLLEAILNQRVWLGFVGAGAALGLAMMTKGPVALLQTLLPIGLWLAFDKTSRSSARSWVRPLVAGIAVFLVIGLAWFAVVILRESRAWDIWYREVSREGATDDPPDKWYTYFSLLLYLGPWIVLFFVGMIVALRRGLGHRDWLRMLPLTMVVVPLAIMALVKDRSERYMLPMLAPAAVVTALGALPLLSPREGRSSRSDIAVMAGQWFILTVIAVGFPLVSATLVEPPWYSARVAHFATWTAAVVIGLGILLAPSGRLMHALAMTTLVAMLGMQAFVIAGYRNAREGRAELRPLAEKIVTNFPDAEIFNGHPKGKPPASETTIYANRPIPSVPDPSTIRRASHPRILLMVQRSDDPDPIAPPGWELFDKAPQDNKWWWAFLLRPEAQN